MKGYESPKMEFKELELFEKIANVCWGDKYATFEDPYDSDNVIDLPHITWAGTGCGEGTYEGVLAQVKAYLDGLYGIGWFETRYMVDYPNNSNNWANTQSVGIETHNS